MRVLLWGAERVGDVVMTIPALKLLRRLQPDAYVCFATTRYAAPVARLVNLADEVTTYRFGYDLLNLPAFARLRRRIRTGEFDAVLLLGKITKFRRKVLSDHSSLVVRKDVPGRHIAEGHVAMVKRVLGAPDADARGLYPDVPVPDEGAADRLRRAGFDPAAGDYAVLHAATHRTGRKRWRRERVGVRLWPPDFQAALLERAASEMPGLRWALVGAKSERGFIERQVRRRAPRAAVNLAGRTSLPDLVALLKHARVLVACDSGVMHLATVVRCPLLALFGPSDESFTGPYSDPSHVRIIRPPGGSKRIEDIPVERVFEAVQGWMGGASGGGGRPCGPVAGDAGGPDRS